jgi:hypothetical protein
MHHGDKLPDAKMEATNERFKKMFEDLQEQMDEAGEKLGATGNFPEGKVATTDEGEIQYAVSSSKGKVIVTWGKPVEWIGMNPQQAIEFANSLKQHALRARAK